MYSIERSSLRSSSKELEDIICVHCIAVFNSPLKYYTVELKNIFKKKCVLALFAILYQSLLLLFKTAANQSTSTNVTSGSLALACSRK